MARAMCSGARREPGVVMTTASRGSARQRAGGAHERLPARCVGREPPWMWLRRSGANGWWRAVVPRDAPYPCCCVVAVTCRLVPDTTRRSSTRASASLCVR